MEHQQKEKKRKEKEDFVERAKEIADKITIEHVDQYNWRIKNGVTNEQLLDWLRILSHFISIPTSVLSETETGMFNEDIFEKINVSNPKGRDTE